MIQQAILRKKQKTQRPCLKTLPSFDIFPNESKHEKTPVDLK